MPRIANAIVARLQHHVTHRDHHRQHIACWAGFRGRQLSGTNRNGRSVEEDISAVSGDRDDAARRGRVRAVAAGFPPPDRCPGTRHAVTRRQETKA